MRPAAAPIRGLSKSTSIERSTSSRNAAPSPGTLASLERGGFDQLFPRQGKIAMRDHFRRLRASAITSSPGIASTSPRRYRAYRRSASSIQGFSISGSCPGSRSSMSTRTSAAFSCAERAWMRLVRSSNWLLTAKL